MQAVRIQSPAQTMQGASAAIQGQTLTSADAVRAAVADRMDTVAFDSWIAPLSFHLCEKSLILVAGSKFSADFIRSAYWNILEDVAKNFGLTVVINVGHVQAAEKNESVNDNEKKIFSLKKKQATAVSFDDFIAGEENLFVLSAAKKIANGMASFSPLFIYGPSGCGKTLLARAIENSAAGRVVCFSGGQFTTEFLRAINEKSIFAFKDFCRNCDTFIIDDVQVLVGKRATCDEFSVLLTDLISAKKNIVITANAAPNALTGFDRRLQSVFASGLVADIAAPSKNVRRTMFLRAGVTADVAESLAARVVADGHLVGGVVKKINAYAELMDEKITAQVASRLLADILQHDRSPLALAKSMAVKLGVSFDEILSASRSRTIVRARQLLMFALKSVASLSLSEIGRVLNRDHATIIYGLKQITLARETDLLLRAEIEQLMSV